MVHQENRFFEVVNEPEPQPEISLGAKNVDRHAGTSITLNPAEGAGEYCRNEKLRFYRTVRQSATECAGILDVCRYLQLVDPQIYTKGRELLLTNRRLTSLVR